MSMQLAGGWHIKADGAIGTGGYGHVVTIWDDANGDIKYFDAAVG